MLITRDLARQMTALATKFPIITLTGPRQSGKTTLVKAVFPHKAYVSLEDLDMRLFAQEDPRGFLSNYPEGAVLDEVQRVPGLFSYLQGIVDQHDVAGEFILTGSHNFLLMEQVSQSLAGRAAILKLMPLSNRELSATKFSQQSPEERLFFGGYPRLYDKQIAPADYYASYIQTYVERDLRQLKNIHNLGLFARFLKLCASRTGQMLNVSSLATDCGISHTAAQAWLSLLQTSYVVYLLQPHHVHFSKRLTKMPKLYFYDTGLACHLLNITDSAQLNTHYLRGGLFENLIVMEFYKFFAHSGREAPLFYWRDKTGHEIDCLIEDSGLFHLVEIKSAQTFADDFVKGIRFYENLNKQALPLKSWVVYAGEINQKRSGFSLLSWKNDLSVLFDNVLHL